MSRTVHKLKINSSVLCGAVTIQELFSRSWVQKFKKIKINQIKRRLKKIIIIKIITITIRLVKTIFLS